MQTALKKEIYINMSHCDWTSHLSIPGGFNLCMDLATEHAESIGIGTALTRAQHIFWVTARTRLHLYRRPAMGETVQAETFMGPGRGPRAARYYRLTKDGEVLAEAKTDFVAMNIQTGQLVKISDFFPQQDEITQALKDQELPLPESAPKISPVFDESKQFASYTVRSTDIDLGGHMHNTAYIRAIMGLFSCSEIDKAGWNDMDIAYRKACYEGEVLQAYLRQKEKAAELALVKPSGEVAVLVRLS